jgi:hypothetical protein
LASKPEVSGDYVMRIIGILAVVFMLVLAGCTGDRFRQSANEQRHLVVAI